MISSFRIRGMDAGAHRACMYLTKSLRLRCWELGAAGRLLPSPAADADFSSVCHPLQEHPPSVPAYLSLVRILILCPRATESCHLLVLGHIVQLPPRSSLRCRHQWNITAGNGCRGRLVVPILNLGNLVGEETFHGAPRRISALPTPNICAKSNNGIKSFLRHRQ